MVWFRIEERGLAAADVGNERGCRSCGLRAAQVRLERRDVTSLLGLLRLSKNMLHVDCIACGARVPKGDWSPAMHAAANALDGAHPAPRTGYIVAAVLPLAVLGIIATGLYFESRAAVDATDAAAPGRGAAAMQVDLPPRGMLVASPATLGRLVAGDHVIAGEVVYRLAELGADEVVLQPTTLAPPADAYARGLPEGVEDDASAEPLRVTTTDFLAGSLAPGRRIQLVTFHARP